MAMAIVLVNTDPGKDRAVIHRAGEWAFDPYAKRPILTMDDFPKLA